MVTQNKPLLLQIVHARHIVPTMESGLTHIPISLIKAAFVELYARNRDCVAYRAKVFIIGSLQ